METTGMTGTTTVGGGAPVPGAAWTGIRLRRAVELVTEAGGLARRLRDQLVLGSLCTLDRDLEAIVTDGTVHRARTVLSSPTPSLEALLRLASAADDLAEGSARLLAGGATGALARIGRPGADLASNLPARLPTGAPRADRTVRFPRFLRFEDLDLPSTLTHVPTRRFLTETGLPEDGFLFQLDTEVALPTLPEYYAEEHWDQHTVAELPSRAAHLIRLGHLSHTTHLVLDGTTGAVLCWSEPDRALRPLDTDLPMLVFTVRLMHCDQVLSSVVCDPVTCDTHQ
ncbi:SUKH-4 family immunity protein [Streptomyces sp. CRN 30]|uniref:SUKH-4 family immunity protein n=1 Tax=Streptomyces sp. CRN 30 TaxID=3075613 RepID=UPI002A7EE95C|nr:SUKH-4 family immunity protein [Streptomyces sp. CRN 30]